MVLENPQNHMTHMITEEVMEMVAEFSTTSDEKKMNVLWEKLYKKDRGVTECMMCHNPGYPTSHMIPYVKETNHEETGVVDFSKGLIIMDRSGRTKW